MVYSYSSSIPLLGGNFSHWRSLNSSWTPLSHILPQTSSSVLPYYHNTAVFFPLLSVCSDVTFSLSHSLCLLSLHFCKCVCVCACSRALCPVCVGIALTWFNPQDGLLDPNPSQIFLKLLPFYFPSLSLPLHLSIYLSVYIYLSVCLCIYPILSYHI